MRLFGGLWFLLLALCVTNQIGASFADPWPSLLWRLCLASFYLLLTVLVINRLQAKAQADEDLLRRNCPEYSSYEASRTGILLGPEVVIT
jgi:hypothetical protein